MDALLRLLLRFFLVPLGYLAAVIVGVVRDRVRLVAAWPKSCVSKNPGPRSRTVCSASLIGGPMLFILLFSMMWLPGAIGILISEAFAIRSWIFHALNGAVSAWIGWQMFARLRPVGPR